MARIALQANLTTAVGVVKAKDVSVPDEFNEADISTRGSAFELVVPTMRKVGIDFTMLWDETDTVFADIYAKYIAGTDITVSCISYDDGDGITGSGINGTWQILKCMRNESLKDVVLADISIKPNGTMTEVEAVGGE